jgi:hypothetical protein
MVSDLRGRPAAPPAPAGCPSASRSAGGGAGVEQVLLQVLLLDVEHRARSGRRRRAAPPCGTPAGRGRTNCRSARAGLAVSRSATPTCCRISSVRRVKTMARLPCDTCSSAFSTTLATPWRASSSAVTSPAGPAPAITTGCRGCGGWPTAATAHAPGSGSRGAQARQHQFGEVIVQSLPGVVQPNGLNQQRSKGFDHRNGRVVERAVLDAPIEIHGHPTLALVQRHDRQPLGHLRKLVAVGAVLRVRDVVRRLPVQQDMRVGSASAPGCQGLGLPSPARCRPSDRSGSRSPVKWRGVRPSSRGHRSPRCAGDRRLRKKRSHTGPAEPGCQPGATTARPRRGGRTGRACAKGL